LTTKLKNVNTPCRWGCTS